MGNIDRVVEITKATMAEQGINSALGRGLQLGKEVAAFMCEIKKVLDEMEVDEDAKGRKKYVTL